MWPMFCKRQSFIYRGWYTCYLTYFPRNAAFYSGTWECISAISAIIRSCSMYCCAILIYTSHCPCMRQKRLQRVITCWYALNRFSKYSVFTEPKVSPTSEQNLAQDLLVRCFNTIWYCTKKSRPRACLLAGSCWNYFFDPEDGGDIFLRNVGCNSTEYKASYPRRWYSS
jgi:hypothetical protein